MRMFPRWDLKTYSLWNYQNFQWGYGIFIKSNNGKWSINLKIRMPFKWAQFMSPLESKLFLCIGQNGASSSSVWTERSGQ